MQQVKGTFDVKRTGQSTIDDAGEGAGMARIRLEKTFHGALDATSVVEMMSVGTAVQGSAAYVALEHVVGRLDGRSGTLRVAAQRHHESRDAYTVGRGGTGFGHRRTAGTGRHPRHRHRRWTALLHLRFHPRVSATRAGSHEETRAVHIAP